LIKSNRVQFKYSFKSKIDTFATGPAQLPPFPGRPTPSCMAHTSHPPLPCSHVTDRRPPPPTAPHAVLHLRGAIEPGPPLLLPPRGAACTEPPPSPPLFSLSTARPQKGADHPCHSFFREHLPEDPNPPRIPTSSLNRFPVAGTLHSMPDYHPSRTANRLPSESSPLAPCASPRWPPHPFPPPSSCKSAPRPVVTTVRSSPPPDTAASTLPRRSSTVQSPSPRPASAPRHGDALGAHLVACTPPASRHHPRRRTSRSRGDHTLRGRRAPR
jgi:hypothetical protein